MIFILNEQIMNGTTTMSIMATGIEADSFRIAVDRLKASAVIQNLILTIVSDDLKIFSYSIAGQFPIFGKMDSNPLKVI